MGDYGIGREDLVEAGAVAAVHVHVAAEGLRGAELSAAEGAGVGARRPRGPHDVAGVLGEGPHFP